MSKLYETHYTPRQRQLFPCKFTDELCKEMNIRYCLGDSIGEIRAWVVEDRRIPCSYNAIRGVFRRERWRRFRTTLTIPILMKADPEFQRMLQETFQEKWEQWRQMADLFQQALDVAISRDPQQASDFIKAAKILVKMFNSLKVRVSEK